MPGDTKITAEAAAFAESLRYDGIPEAALKVGRRCMIDGIGQFVNSDKQKIRLSPDSGPSFL